MIGTRTNGALSVFVSTIAGAYSHLRNTNLQTGTISQSGHGQTYRLSVLTREGERNVALVGDPNKAPRSCITGSKTNRRFKKRYARVEDIPERLLNDLNLYIYECYNCSFFHLGHLKVEDELRKYTAVLYVWPSRQRWVYKHRQPSLGSRHVRETKQVVLGGHDGTRIA